MLEFFFFKKVKHPWRMYTFKGVAKMATFYESALLQPLKSRMLKNLWGSMTTLEGVTEEVANDPKGAFKNHIDKFRQVRYRERVNTVCKFSIKT